MNYRSAFKQVSRPVGLLALLLFTLLLPVSLAYGNYQPTEVDVNDQIPLPAFNEVSEVDDVNGVNTAAAFILSDISEKKVANAGMEPNQPVGHNVKLSAPSAFNLTELQLITDTSQLQPHGQFGHSVSISGTMAIVGSPYENINGVQSGSATIYGWNGNTWQQEAKLVPGDGRSHDYFGQSVSISGDVAIVGAWRASGNQSYSGAAYIYRKNGNAWVLDNKVMASDGGYWDNFGRSVSIHGDLALIGSRNNSRGAAYVFHWDGQDWVQEQKLTASDAGSYSWSNFGFSVSLNGHVALIGNTYNYSSNTYTEGSAYVFSRDNDGNWIEEQKLTASDGALWDSFGQSVSLRGNVALIGAPYDDDGQNDSGSAYVFTRTGNTWSQQQKLTASDNAQNNYFGLSVSLDQNRAIVGTAGVNGSAYLFSSDSSSWQEENKLTPDHNNSQGWSYWWNSQAVSISGDQAIVGVPFHYDNIRSQHVGMAYVYNLASGDVPDIAVSPSSMIATIGAEQQRGYQLVIKNNYGTQPLDFSISSSEDWLRANPSFGIVPAGEVYTVSIEFDNTDLSLGDYHASLTVKSNDPDEPSINVPLLVQVISEYKLTASNGATNRHFGQKVALDGTIGVVGSNTQVHFYHQNGANWREEGPLTFDQGVSSVAIYDNIAVIGVANDDETATDAGAVHVYEWNNSDWALRTKLLASEGAANDQFGYSVAIHRNLMAIGAPGDEQGEGVVYLYRKNGNNWQYDRMLTASDGDAQDQLGFAVSVYNSTIDDHDLVIAGAPYDDDNSSNSGAAYIFRRDRNTWEQASKLTITDVTFGSEFGRAVAINENLVAVGSKYDEILIDPLYVYRWNGSTWAQEAKINPIGGGTWRFASTLSISGDDTVLVGDSGYNDDEQNSNWWWNPWGWNGKGAGYLFKYEEGSWQQKKVILASDGANADYFGSAVALSGDVALIGAPQDDDNGFNSGSAYIYDFSDGFGTPDINLSAEYLEFSLAEGEQITTTGFIENTGNGDLLWQMNWTQEWVGDISEDSSTELDIVLPNRSGVFSVALPADNITLTDGVYEDVLTFTSNDPNEPSVEVPIKLIIGSGEITSVSPNTAVSNAGDVSIVIKGYHFQENVTARLGSTSLSNVRRGTDDYSVLHAVVPVSSLAEGSYDLTVQSGDDTLTLADAFTVTPSVEEKPFLAMVYLACDSNLSADCGRLFNNLELAVQNNPNLHVAAFWDGHGGHKDGYYLVQPDSEPIAWASYNSSNRKLLGEIDSADPSTLVEFVGWARSQYPGTHSFLSLVDHGSGWAPDLYPAQPIGYPWNAPSQEVGGMFWDDAAGNVMSVEALASALQSISNAQKLDVIYLDACLMGTVEVMGELSPYAQYIVSHENLSWAVYPYDKYFAGIDGTTEPAALAQHIAQTQHEALIGGHPSQVSVFDTSKMDAVDTALNSLADALSAYLDVDDISEEDARRRQITRAVLQAAKVDENINFELDDQDNAFDLYHFAELLSTNSSMPNDVTSAANQVMTAIHAAVDPDHNYTHSDAPWPVEDVVEWDMENLHGLSIYFPLNNEWKRRFYNERALPRFAAASTWDDFIQDDWYGNSREAEGVPTESCDPLHCIVAPMHLALTIDQPITASVGAETTWVPISLHGATSLDDVTGVQLSVKTKDLNMLVPDSDSRVRNPGDLFPIEVEPASEATEDEWHVVLTNISASEAISGTGVMVELPFNFLDYGCADVEFTTHLLTDSTLPYYINNQAINKTICTTEFDPLVPVLVRGKATLERIFSPKHDGIEVRFANGSLDETTTDRLGDFEDQVVRGDYTVRYRKEFYLRAEQQVTIPGRTTINPVTLCAGDMDGNGRITSYDQTAIERGTIPVGIPEFDLNADGRTNVRDVQIVVGNRNDPAKNVAPADCSNSVFARSASRATTGLSNTAESAAPQAARHFPVSVPTDKEWEVTLSLQQVSDAIDGAGIRLALPTGSTVNEDNVELMGDFVGGYLNPQFTDDDDKLYLVMLPPEGNEVTQDTDVVRFTMNAPDNVTNPVITIEATNPSRLQEMWRIDVGGTNNTLYLPILQRKE